VSWILISYRIPREPSTKRIAVWRRLRRLGALQILKLRRRERLAELQETKA
jgi:hypothetical protein